MSATAAGLFPVVAMAVNALGKSGEHNHQSLEFADRHGLGPEMDAPDVERYCQPLHQEKLLSPTAVDQNILATATQILKFQVRDAGLQWHEDYQVGFTYQHYGVPDNSELTDPLLAYCEYVNDYAHAKLPHMFNAKVHWQPLTHDDAVGGVPAFRGFVGRYTYYVVRAVVLNPHSGGELPYLVQASPVERAIHYIESGESAAPKRGTLYIIPGTTSLVAPFSELLHLTFHEPSQRYATELTSSLGEVQAKERARIAGETVNEAAAIVLASEFLQKMGHSERLPTVKFMTDNLSDTYGYLPKAIAYMRRNSVQDAVDMYFDNPARFMASIENA
jgi:hypothetical protein